MSVSSILAKIPLELSVLSKIILEETPHSRFFKKPVATFVCREDAAHFHFSQKVSALFKDFADGLPVAYGQLGPSAYAEEAFKLKDKVGGSDVYGWKPGAKRNENTKKCYAIVLGAKKLDREYVYYLLAEDVTPNQSNNVRKFQPSKIHTRVYVASLKTFCLYLNNFYPPKKHFIDFDAKCIPLPSPF
jgi:hypothetical protein